MSEPQSQREPSMDLTRALVSWPARIVTGAALLFGLYEVVFFFNFNYTLYSLFTKFGVELSFLRHTFQTKQGMAFVLAMVFIISFVLYPARRKRADARTVGVTDWILAGMGAACAFYIFFVYGRYALNAEVQPLDIVIGLATVVLVLEATRRVVGWVLPAVVGCFILYGIIELGFRWPRITQQLVFDEGILGIPLMVMVTYVFAFVFFGAFLLRIGVSDYVTEFMIAVFGPRAGGPAKAAVVSSGLMGTVSGSSVANVLTTGTFTIPLMKKAGYPPEVAGAIEPVASTGGQLMPPIMGAAAFIMAEFLGIPYRTIIVAAIVPALVYYFSVYVFVDLETRRLGLGGVPRQRPLRTFARKLYLLLPVVIITVALLRGLPPQICAVASLGIAVWVAWLSKDGIPGSERVYVAIATATTILMFLDERYNGFVLVAFLSFIGLLVALSFTRHVSRNEKFYMSILFVAFIAVARLAGMKSEQVLLLSGVAGMVLTIIVSRFATSAEGRSMFSATYDAIVSASKTSVSVMLAAAAAGLIQAVLTMTGLITSIGYDLVSVTGGTLLLLLPLAMLFSLILGMGVPTTANYIITSLVAAPAIFLVVQSSELYGAPVPGFSTPVALLAAHFFVFYFGILADVTPPVALASYAGSALARSDFWKTSLNALKYASAGYVGPYVYFLHPQLFLVTIGDWSPATVAYILYFIAGALIAMFLLATALTGWCDGELRRVVRVVLLAFTFGIVITMHPAVVVTGAVITLLLLRYQRRLISVLY
ncbi:MAG: TRAP transporter fused permease subunit [Dehalococcoidia bacterium]|nr:TRAP transporter fused permease subunit [Dehalococcoidia bacterium]